MDEQAVDTTRQERSDASKNRELILETAKQLFAAQGVAQTNMKEIAIAAGVGKGTLYRHFAHKGELCAALLHEDVTAFEQRVGAMIDRQHDRSPLARLEYLIVERIRLTESHLPLFAAINEVTAGARPARPFRGQFGAWLHARSVELLREAVDAGEVGPIDFEFTADVILEATSPPLYNYHRNTLGYSLERVVQGMRMLFIDGLRNGGDGEATARNSRGLRRDN